MQVIKCPVISNAGVIHAPMLLVVVVLRHCKTILALKNIGQHGNAKTTQVFLKNSHEP